MPAKKKHGQYDIIADDLYDCRIPLHNEVSFDFKICFKWDLDFIKKIMDFWSNMIIFEMINFGIFYFKEFKFLIKWVCKLFKIIVFSWPTSMESILRPK